MWWMSAAGAVALLSAAFASDIRSMTIPNRLTLPAMAAGAVCHAMPGIGKGLAFALAGCSAGFGVMFLIYLCRAVGAGDVKLFAALGAWVGASDVVHTAIYALLFAGACGIGVLAVRRAKPDFAKTGQMPFMLAVVPGAAAAWLF